MSSSTSLLISRALEDVREYQEHLVRDPGVAQVSLAGVPHALLPTHVVARDLPRELEDQLAPEVIPLVMYRLGFIIGRTHAAAFFEHREIGDAEPEYRVLTGPFHFAWAGYGDVELLLFEPQPGEDFLCLWESDNSFSAREATGSGHRSRACHLQGGYSAGWCTEATGLPLETSEIACRAEGVSHCRFVIAHRRRMHERLLDPRLHQPTKHYSTVSARMPEPAAA